MQVLKPTETHRPVIDERSRRKIEALCFSINSVMLPGYRSALETFGVITPIGRHNAWIVNPLTPAELDAIGGIDEPPMSGSDPDEDDAEGDGPE